MVDSARSTRGLTFPQQVLIVLIVVTAALLVWHTLQMFLLIFAGIIFAIFLRKNGDFIHEKTGLSVNWSITIVIFLLLILVLGVIFLITPNITDQVQELNKQLPNSWKSLKENVSETTVGGWFLKRLPSLEQISGSIGGLMQKATSWLYTAVGAITGIFIILAIGLYGAYDADTYIGGAEKLVPKKKRDRAIRTFHGIGATLYWWLIGRLFSMLIIGVFTVLGLWLLGMPLALTLGVFAALLTFIPNLGPIISVIPALLLAVQESWSMVWYVAALYAGIQMVESYLITPLVQRQAISMPPALIISAQIIMGVIQGIIGILLATPLVAVLIVITKLLYLEDVLEEHDIHIQAEDRESTTRN